MLNAWPKIIKINRWKPMSKSPIARPKTRWEDDVLEDIKSINIGTSKEAAQTRDSWKKVVEQARTLYRLWRYITSLEQETCHKFGTEDLP